MRDSRDIREIEEEIASVKNHRQQYAGGQFDLITRRIVVRKLYDRTMFERLKSKIGEYEMLHGTDAVIRMLDTICRAPHMNPTGFSYEIASGFSDIFEQYEGHEEFKESTYLFWTLSELEKRVSNLKGSPSHMERADARGVVGPAGPDAKVGFARGMQPSERLETRRFLTDPASPGDDGEPIAIAGGACAA